MITATMPAWCDPALSREERIASVDIEGVSFCLPATRPCDCAGGILLSKGGQDRYGLHIMFGRCNICDAGWLAYRPSPDWYANFYASGTYRKLVSAYHGRDVMLTIEQEQQDYALRLIRKLPTFSGGRILDVGGSTGTVGRCVALAMNGIVDVLDPAPECNDNPMVNFIQGSLETWEASHKYKLVLLCQTIDHLLEPRACLEKIRGLLASDGLFFVDILDTEQEVAEKGWQQTLKIDHPFYFTDKSARLLLNATGFEIVDSWESARNHIGYLCKGRA
jgi:hypothetical protein